MAILLLIDYQQFARDNDENTVAAEVKQLRQRLQSEVFVAMNKVRRRTSGRAGGRQRCH